MEKQPKPLTPQQIDEHIQFLQALVEDRERMAELSEQQRIELLTAAGRLASPDRKERRERTRAWKQAQKKKVQAEEKLARAATGIRSAREDAVFSAPRMLSAEELADTHKFTKLHSPRNCYVCKAEYTDLHHFYDSMCPSCAELNYAKRFQTADLRGQVAIITGSRLKIGYQATLMLLRAGATVVATTRFPVDSALRYSKEADYSDWGHRLQVYGLDLRHTPSVEIFCTWIEQHYERLDILINNAAQTVRRPSGFYAHLMENENADIQTLSAEVRSLLREHEDCKQGLYHYAHQTLEQQKNMPVKWDAPTPGIGLRSSAQLSQIPYAYDNELDAHEVFPSGKLDADLQQVDLRRTNSWRLTLGDIPTSEMLELQLVNSVAPFVLANKLLPLMRRDNTGEKHIINVTAMEGKFYRFKKGPRHPHTNMAKAALNMLTHTSASELADYGIWMNAVDTGWVTDEDPAHLAQYKQEVHDFQPPLDIVDGAARVLDPLFDGINTGKHWCGQFLKDYFPIDW